MSAVEQHTRPQDAELPIIDISRLKSRHAADRQAVGAALRETCMRHGFFYINGHGISEDLQRMVFDKTRRFFALPLEQKLAVDKARSRANRGYEPLRGQTLEPGAPPDLKEGFYIGEDLPEDDRRVVAQRFNHGPNQWPEGIPGFRETMQGYFYAMVELNKLLMQGLALSLDLPEHYFEDFCREPQATLRLLHYPPQQPQPAPSEKGAGAHTDFGGITLLLQDDNRGLQVWDYRNERWLGADPVPGSYVANLGDMIARWTNDRYRSTLHRVINTSGRERYSVPFFFSGNADYEIRCLPGCLAPGESPRYSPVTVEEHLMEMYRRTYG